MKKNGIIEPMVVMLDHQYRILTPKMRTIDEQPFRRREIKLIKSIFPKAEIKYFNCLTLLAVPFRNSKNFEWILTLFKNMDKYLLHNRSPFKWLAWNCQLILKND